MAEMICGDEFRTETGTLVCAREPGHAESTHRSEDGHEWTQPRAVPTLEQWEVDRQRERQHEIDRLADEVADWESDPPA